MFSAKAHYGLKAAVYLARQTGKGPIQAHEIAETQNIPVRYLELLLSQMKKARLINSNRGKLGGYRLARAAAAISVFDIIIALEGKVTFVSSHEIKDNDLIELAVTDFWTQAETNLVGYLKQTSLEELKRRAETDKQMYHI